MKTLIWRWKNSSQQTFTEEDGYVVGSLIAQLPTARLELESILKFSRLQLLLHSYLKEYQEH